MQWLRAQPVLRQERNAKMSILHAGHLGKNPVDVGAASAEADAHHTVHGPVDCATAGPSRSCRHPDGLFCQPGIASDTLVDDPISSIPVNATQVWTRCMVYVSSGAVQRFWVLGSKMMLQDMLVLKAG